MGKHIKFRVFLVVIFVFIGAVIFISEPFVNNTQNPVKEKGNVVSTETVNTVSIDEEKVAKGIPAAPAVDSRLKLVAIVVTVINIAGAIGIVIMTNRDVNTQKNNNI